MDTFGTLSPDGHPLFVADLPNDRGGEKTHHQYVRSEQELQRFITDHDKPGRALYYTVAHLAEGGWRKKEDVAASHWVWAEVDSKDHPDIPLEEVLRRLMASPRRPNLIVFSGHGYHALWRLSEPVDARPGEAQQQLEEVLKLACAYVGGDPQVAEASRLMRLPGSHNTRKAGENLLAEVIHVDNLSCELEDLLDFFLGAQPILPPPREKANGHASAQTFQSNDAPVDVEACLAAMTYQDRDASVNATLCRVIPSLLRRGEHPDDVLDRVVGAVMAMAERRRLDWSEKTEVGTTVKRILSAYQNLLLKDYDPATGEIPVWLPGEFHGRWAEVLTEGRCPRFGFNRGGFYVKKERIADGAAVADGATPLPPQPAARKYRFPLIAFGDLRPGSEQSYLIDELFPTAGLALVYGAPKSGKSFWTFDAMMHIALSWEYRERAVQSGPVVYCAFEGAHGYHKRGEAFRRHHCLTDERPPMFVVPGRADLIKDHAALIADMRAQLADAGITHPPRAVVLDTLNKSLIGSESKDVDMTNYIAAAEAIQKAFNCLVVIVHHHGIEESRPRGHTSLRGAIDVMIKITRDVQNNIIAIVEEMRDGPEGAQIASRLVVVTVGQDLKGRPLTSAAVEPVEMAAAQRGPRLTPNQKTMLSLLEEAGPAGLSINEWNDRAREAGLGKHRRATLADLRAELRRKRLVSEQGERWVAVAPRGPDL
jgi:hypothetical protein